VFIKQTTQRAFQIVWQLAFWQNNESGYETLSQSASSKSFSLIDVQKDQCKLGLSGESASMVTSRDHQRSIYDRHQNFALRGGSK
jgi:hypothetical protein